uniref:Uncharacterized protein n=1 Tax=Micrurus lemniscatus lemniscatus TaxID=129467 RepID=A0A2D4IUE1_MICLE
MVLLESFSGSVTSFNLWLLYIDKWSREPTLKKIGVVSTKSMHQTIRSVTNHCYKLMRVQRRDSDFSLLYINVCNDVSIHQFVTDFFSGYTNYFSISGKNEETF